MANTKTFTQAFNGGEVTPEFFGRIGDAKFEAGLAALRNFIALPHGPAANRSGTALVREVADSTKRTRLIPFAFSLTQTFMIELGAGYFRFHTQGATVLNNDDGNPYQIANPYQEADIFDIHYVQSADVMTLVHPSYPAKELRRYGANDWRLVDVSFGSTLLPPATVKAVATLAPSPSNTRSYSYVVTAVGSNNIDESVVSVSASCTNNLLQTGAFNTITWSAVAGAQRYNIYLLAGGLYSYVGQGDTSLTFVDNNISPNMGKTPPINITPFEGGGMLSSVTVLNKGSKYGTVGAVGGQVQSITVLNGGTGYTAGPNVTVSDPTGTGLTFTVQTADEGTLATGTPSGTFTITGITVTNPGSGYSNPTFIISGTGGSGASLSAVIKPTVWAPITLSVTDVGGPGTGAVLSAAIDNGQITSVSVINPGQGYVNPIVTVTNGAGGTGGQFQANITGTTNYPSAVSYYEQRRCFAGTIRSPQALLMTKSGTESNMNYSIPTRDDDAISIKIAAREANPIRHIVPLQNLVLLTSAAAFRVTSVNSDAITPTSISVKPQAYVGSNNVQPLSINNNLLYAAARGGHIRELSFSFQNQGYISGDLSLRAPHLFDGLEIVDMAESKAPYPICWFISSNGKLLGLTYVPEQNVAAWHRHDTDGVFESCAVVTEGKDDALYVIVQRTINGQQKRFVERFSSRFFTDTSDAFFVDCGSTYSGAPTKAISGLDWLEGKAVAIVADGAVQPQQTVIGGKINLVRPASRVTVGLPYQSDLQTLPLVAQIDNAFGQGRYKNLNRVWVRCFNSAAFLTGPDFDHLTESRQRTTEPYGTAPQLKSRDVEVVIDGSWNDSGQLAIRQSYPLPITITSVAMEVSLGG